MRAFRSRRSRIAVAAVVLAVAGTVSAVLATQHETVSAKERFEQSPALKFIKGGDPDQSQKDTPGTDRGLGSPSSYEDQQLAALAYPSDKILASQLKHERNVFLNQVAPRTPTLPSGSWSLVGPTTSTQPAALNFFDAYAGNDFQGHDFQVSGRITAMAVAPSCNETSCMLWVAAAGGGVWRNDNALDPNSQWTYLSSGFGTNAIGTLTYDAGSHTLYAGTGEPNASGDSEAGVGIYASTDNGDTWTLLPGSPAAFNARAVSSIVVDPNSPNTLYVGTTRAVRGVSGVAGGAVSLAPDAPKFGLWKSTDGGQTFNFLWNGNGSARGVNHVELDATHNTIYASAFQQGIWRSTNGGLDWTQVFATQDPTENTARTEFSLNYTPDGHTRIYVSDGGTELTADALPPTNSGVYRADAIDTKSAAALTNGTTNPGYESLTSDGTTPDGRRDTRFGSYDVCETQCWYDNYVYSPPGHPDDVYIGGSFNYNFYSIWGGRAVLLSQDAGASWTEQTTSADTNVGIHPDQHALVTDPANPLLFFEGSDGGVVRSSGQLTDNGTAFCDPAVTDGLTTSTSSVYAACLNLHKAVPTSLFTINAGLSTLQFQNIVVNPNDPSQLMGGTQDNGTWLGTNDTSSWNQTIYGDGGVAAFDATDPNYELNEFFDRYTDGNFEGGDPTKWVILSGPFFASGEGSEFYKPQIGDPVVGGTFFVGLQSVWRTQDYGGDKTYLEANCPEFTTPGDQAGCGDFVPLGDASGKGGPKSQSDLTSKNYGRDREGGFVAALARTPSDTSTLWAATATGRVFISTNADAKAGKVRFTRLDSLSSTAPGRFVTGIVIDPNNADHAWISYSGYSSNTPDQPGHVFDVLYNPRARAATWTAIDAGTSPLDDLPVTGLARDDSTGMLYAATDFGVLASDGDGSWAPAAPGMPQVEVPWVTIDPTTNTLYAATHGRGIWSLSLG